MKNDSGEEGNSKLRFDHIVSNILSIEISRFLVLYSKWRSLLVSNFARNDLKDSNFLAEIHKNLDCLCLEYQ